MSEMVKRVAAALTAEFEPYRVFNEGEAESLARAAIAAMREPTDAMRREGIAGIARDHGDVTGIYFDLNIVFRDMVDAALK